MPLRQDDTALIARYEKVFSSLTQLDISPAIYDDASLLRAHHNLKTPDALHLATAQHYKCTEFWTNDLRLSKVSGAMSFKVLP